MQARQVRISDFDDFEYLIAMDDSNVENLKKLMQGTQTEVIRLLDLVPDEKIKNVPDPYHTGNFEEVYALIGQGIQALLSKIRQEHPELAS